MSNTVRFMFATAATVLLPLCPAFNYQAVQGAQQDNSLEGRIAQLQQEVQANPRNPDLHFELSKLYEEDVGRYYDEALSEFGLAVDYGLEGRSEWRDSRKVGKINNKGISLFNKGKYDKAIEKFEEALEEDTNNPHTYNNLSGVYFTKGEFGKAIEYAKIAVDLDHTNANFHMSTGAAYLKKGDFELSLLNYNKIGHIDSNHYQQYFGVATAYYGLGQYNDAIGALNKLPESVQEIPQIVELRKKCVDGLLK